MPGVLEASGHGNSLDLQIRTTCILEGLGSLDMGICHKGVYRSPQRRLMIGRVLACGYFGSKLDFDDMTGESEEAVRARSTCDTTCMTRTRIC